MIYKMEHCWYSLLFVPILFSLLAINLIVLCLKLRCQIYVTATSSNLNMEVRRKWIITHETKWYPLGAVRKLSSRPLKAKTKHSSHNDFRIYTPRFLRRATTCFSPFHPPNNGLPTQFTYTLATELN